MYSKGIKIKGKVECRKVKGYNKSITKRILK